MEQVPQLLGRPTPHPCTLCQRGTRRSAAIATHRTTPLPSSSMRILIPASCSSRVPSTGVVTLRRRRLTPRCLRGRSHVEVKGQERERVFQVCQQLSIAFAQRRHFVLPPPGARALRASVVRRHARAASVSCKIPRAAGCVRDRAARGKERRAQGGGHLDKLESFVDTCGADQLDQPLLRVHIKHGAPCVKHTPRCAAHIGMDARSPQRWRQGQGQAWHGCART